MHELQSLLTNRIASGLKRKSITKCSTWAENYRIMGQPYPGKWSFKHHPWTREMHDAEDYEIIGQKAAQMGFTEACLNRCFYSLDIKAQSILYILPTDGDASNFSASRFDPALEQSPHLKKIFSNVKNVGHKRAGSANLFVRGSRSRSALKSDPVSKVIFDELDEMNQNHISLAEERMSGQSDIQTWKISTPTIDDFGINGYYNNSTQDHYFFKCPRCGKQTELIFPDCLIITAEEVTDPRIKETHLVCKECKGRLEHRTKVDWLQNGEWVAKYPGRLSRGFHINQLYSMADACEPYKIAILYLKSLTNPTDAQEFNNSKLGIVYVADGAQVTDEMLDEAIGGYTSLQTSPPNAFVTMGIDVGKWCHYEITQYIFDKEVSSPDLAVISRARVLKAGKVLDFYELDTLMRQYKVSSCVIDSQPETRLALEFANRFYGLVHLCIYGQGVSGKNIHLHAEGEHKVTVDRTSWLDASMSRFKGNRIHLPQDIGLEYRQHIKAPVRIYKKDQNGNPMGLYVNGGKDDHFAHARNYSEIALACGLKNFGSQDTESPI